MKTFDHVAPWGVRAKANMRNKFHKGKRIAKKILKKLVIPIGILFFLSSSTCNIIIVIMLKNPGSLRLDQVLGGIVVSLSIMGNIIGFFGFLALATDSYEDDWMP